MSDYLKRLYRTSELDLKMVDYIYLKLSRGEYEYAESEAKLLCEALQRSHQDFLSEFGKSNLSKSLELSGRLMALIFQKRYSEAIKIAKPLRMEILKNIDIFHPHFHILREIACPYCEKNNPMDAVFCGHCGKQLP